jgi:hypothetical protein
MRQPGDVAVEHLFYNKINIKSSSLISDLKLCIEIETTFLGKVSEKEFSESPSIYHLPPEALSVSIKVTE